MTEKSKIYTPADFERYHAGTMPANEMYELEKAALEDPFLADALEGYTYTPSFKNDITELKEKLNKKRKRKNGFSISSFAQSGWWRIAALFIVITGAGYFFYKLNYKNNKNPLAVKEIKSFPPKKDSAINNNDTFAKTNDVAFESHQLSTDEEKEKINSPAIKSQVQKEPIANKNDNDIQLSKISGRSNSEESDSIKFDMTTGKSDKKIVPRYLLKGKVTDENGSPVAFATIQNKNKAEATVADSSGLFLLSSPDSNTTVMITAPGYERKNFALQKDKELVIAMNKSSANLAEVVVTGYSKKKQSHITGSSTQVLKEKVSGVEISQKPILSNNEKFDQYINDNIKPVYDESDSLLTGEVLLSFAVNKKGRPYKIQVVKSSCKACEKEAKQLLESGPRWNNENHKLKTVLIKF